MPYYIIKYKALDKTKVDSIGDPISGQLEFIEKQSAIDRADEIYEIFSNVTSIDVCEKEGSAVVYTRPHEYEKAKWE